MDVNLPLHYNLDKFLRMTQELERCDDKVKDSHQAILLMNSLPSQFDNFKDVIQYSSDELTKDKILEAILEKNEVLKVFKSKTEKKTEAKSEILLAKGKCKNYNKFPKKFEKKMRNLMRVITKVRNVSIVANLDISLKIVIKNKELILIKQKLLLFLKINLIILMNCLCVLILCLMMLGYLILAAQSMLHLINLYLCP